MPVRDLIIVGAGPSGLSAAIAAKQRGLDYQILEQGMLVNSIYRFPPQMVFFTTPELLEIGGLPFVSPYEKPTRAEAHVTLVHRWPELKSTIKYWVKPDVENRIKEGSIAARFNTCVSEIRPTAVVVRTAAGPKGPGEIVELPADAVFLLTGYHPDWQLLADAGVALDTRGVPAYDPQTFETNVPGLFVAGGAISG